MMRAAAFAALLGVASAADCDSTLLQATDLALDKQYRFEINPGSV
jgi:hypothetical protein